MEANKVKKRMVFNKTRQYSILNNIVYFIVLS